jgi:ABC-type uncharacterized transport system involved in gliding motility auxiliary subunit
MVIEQPNQMHMQIPGMDQPRIGHKNEGVPSDLLEHYGFKVRDDIIMEPNQDNQEPGVLVINGEPRLARFPTFVLSMKLAQDPITAGIPGAIFSYCSSVELLKDKQPGFTLVPLAQSSKDAWRESGFFLMNPLAELKPKDDRGPFVLAAYGQGKLKSFFAGKPYPNEKGEKVPPPDPNSSQPPGVELPLAESQGISHVLVVGDANFASDEYLSLSRYDPNYMVDLKLAVKMMYWLTQDDTLAEVRAKVAEARPLAVSDGKATALKWINIAGVPLLFILYGILRWQLRTARRRLSKL